METPLRVLLVEDSESDAALVIRQLKKADYTVTTERVETAMQMRVALENQAWDCVIADYKLPQFDAPAALAVLQATGLDLPFIVVSGTIGEETAVALMKAGAHDYLMKDRLTRLAPAVKHALAEKRLRDEKRQVEQTLRVSMAQYRLLADNISDVIWILDLQTARFTYVSPSAEQLYGYTVAEVLAQEMSSIFTPDSLALFQKNTPGRLASAQQGQCGPYLDEVEQPRKDGTAVWTETTTHYHFNADSDHWEAYGVSRDITARQRAEKALRESEERFRRLFATSPDAIVLIDPHAANADWPIVDCNEAACQMNGYTREELIGQSIDILNPEPETRGGRLAYLDRIRREGVIHVEAFHRHQDGHVFPIEVSTSLFTFEGRELVLGIDRDSTARQQAADVLRESEERFRALVENSADVIALLNGEGVILYESPAVKRVLGYEPAEMVGHAGFEFLHPDDYAATQELYEKMAQQPHMPVVSEVRYRRKDGTWAWIQATGTNLLTEPSVKAIVINYHDVTERKRAEEAVRASERRERERAAELQTIMDTVPTTIWIAHDQMCEVVTGNRAAYELLRVTSGSNASLTAPEDQRPARHRIYQNGLELSPNDLPLQLSAATGVEIRDFEEEIVFDDGTIVYALGNVMPLLDETGRPRGAVGAFIDITERKRAEEQINDALNYNRTLLETSPVGIITYRQTGEAVSANDSAARLSGATVEQLLAQNFRQIEAWQESGLLTLAEEALTTHRAVEQELRHVSSFGNDTWVNVRFVPFTHKSELQLLGMFTDITGRKHLEEQLREQVATLQALAEIDREIMAATEAASVLELVCRRAAELVHAPKSALITMTAATEVDLAASFGFSDVARASAEFMRTHQADLMNFSILNTRGAIALDEIAADNPVMLETLSREGVRALAIVPLIVGKEPSGALIVLDTTVRQWQAADLQILSMLAGQAALALEKLRLLETARSRARHLETLNEIGQAVTSSLDLDRVLTTLLDKVRQATESEACSVALVEPASGDLVFRQAVGGVANEVIGLRLPPGQGLAGWVAQHRQSILVPDAAADARAYPLRDQDNFVTRDLIAVPLITRDVVTGVIELVNKRHGRFSEDDRRLLESVAAQAAIAIEHARLFETEHAGRESLETLYRVGQAVNSTLDADTILDLLTDEALRATHATHGSALVARPDRGCFERRSLRGYSPEQAARARADWLPLDRGVNGRAYHSHQTVYVEDVQLDPEYHPLIAETRSELAVPILRGGQVIGNLDLQSPVADAFRDVRLDFLQALTAQVAIALENARLFEETRRRVDEMSIVAQVALVGAAGRPFDETVARATDALSRLWPEASLGFFFVDEAGQLLRPHRSYYGLPPETLAAVIIPTSTGIIGWAVRERQPVRVGDVKADPRYIIIAPGTQSVMAAPLVAGDRVIGVVSVDSPRSDGFSGDDLRLLTTLAGQLATIFEKARLDAELAGHAAQLEQRVQERTAEIRREQARTQAILDALGEGVVVTDTQGTIQYVNPAMEQATGYTARECIGQNPRLWKSGQTPPAVYESMWTTLLAGQTWRGEIVNRRKDGEFYFAALAAAPILAAGDTPDPFAGLVGVQRDITERKRAEEEMRRALEKEKELNNLKSNFVSLTSHEFRTPLTTILSSAEMLEHYGERWTPEKKLVHLRRIQTAVQHMTTLLNDILIIGKAEAGRLEFAPARLDLVKFCRDLLEEIQLTDKASHTLLFDNRAECVPVSMDEQLLRHIVSNLLVNALKYSPQGGVVQFDLDCQAGQAVFRIQDHGLGIPLEDQARLFETFHRASNARNIPGTGLGLAIVKRSVDLHGGTIDIISQVGVGTTVTVTLPLGVSSEA